MASDTVAQPLTRAYVEETLAKIRAGRKFTGGTSLQWMDFLNCVVAIAEDNLRLRDVITEYVESQEAHRSVSLFHSDNPQTLFMKRETRYYDALQALRKESAR